MKVKLFKTSVQAVRLSIAYHCTTTVYIVRLLITYTRTVCKLRRKTHAYVMLHHSYILVQINTSEYNVQDHCRLVCIKLHTYITSLSH